jgi:osmoprotectant transport system ATP-binding protein
MIELREVRKQYGGTIAVGGLSLHVDAGEVVVLVGPSGCGKTTTLKLINRLIEPTSGTIAVAGRETRAYPPHELRRRIGYCFQQIGLFPHLTVGENVAITPTLMGWPQERIRPRVEELLELVELEPSAFQERWPAELSGGQQQRVGIARALAAQPDVLLMDEPFGALDPMTRDRLRERFRTIQRDLGVTTVLVTHDTVEALLLGSRIAVMEAGRLLQVGSPHELLSAPANDTVRELFEAPRRQAEAVEALLGDTRR